MTYKDPTPLFDTGPEVTRNHPSGSQTPVPAVTNTEPEVPDTPEARVEKLEAAIRSHRLAVGAAYHHNGFRHTVAANAALWALVAEQQPTSTPDTETNPTGLARPAMLDDTEGDHDGR